jgi:hypothetical protein
MSSSYLQDPNEKLVGVKTNKLGEVNYVKYTTATP